MVPVALKRCHPIGPLLARIAEVIEREWQMRELMALSGSKSMSALRLISGRHSKGRSQAQLKYTAQMISVCTEWVDH
jgi:hypothetical protein